MAAELVKYNEACRALADAVTLDEAKDIRDRGDALRVYARQAKNRQLETAAAEIRFRAERRIGELMAGRREAGELNEGRPPKINGSVSDPFNSTLEFEGIGKHLADRSRKLASLSAADFQETLGRWRVEAEDEDRPVRVDLLKYKSGTVHVSHNSGAHEWYTPPEYIAAARAVLGAIDLDPASSAAANAGVGATRFYTSADDGLSLPWEASTIWLNPPYGQPLIAQFCFKLVETVSPGSVSAVALVNNASETAWWQGLAGEASAISFPKGRIRFLDSELNPKLTPLQGQTIFYFGPDGDVFKRVFAEFGAVW